MKIPSLYSTSLQAFVSKPPNEHSFNGTKSALRAKRPTSNMAMRGATIIGASMLAAVARASWTADSIDTPGLPGRSRSIVEIQIPAVPQHLTGPHQECLQDIALRQATQKCLIGAVAIGIPSWREDSLPQFLCSHGIFHPIPFINCVYVC